MSELQTALRAIADEVGYVQKDAKNSHHRYKYASAEAVLSKVRESCQKQGVVITSSDVELIHQGDDGLSIVRITQTYSKGDESATFRGLGGGKDGQDKGPMKANTAALKYLLANAFNISWGDDPEADSSLEKAASKPKKTAKAATKEAKGPRVAKAQVLENIAGASDMTQLEKVKADVNDGRTSKDAEWKELVKAWKKRKEELS